MGLRNPVYIYKVGYMQRQIGFPANVYRFHQASVFAYKNLLDWPMNCTIREFIGII